jgi:predicted porin
MKKTIIAAAVAAAVAAPAAFADVSVSGQINQEFYKVEDGDLASDRNADIVFKASEDLGNGMKAFVTINQMFDTDDSRNSVTTNGLAFLGLSGDFGTISMGLQEMLIESHAAAMAANDASDFLTNEVDTAIGTAAESTFTYISPSFSGVSVGLGAQGDTSGANEDLDDTEFMIQYSNGPLLVRYAHATDHSASQDDRVLGVQYTMGDLTVGVVNQNSDAANGDETWYGAKYVMGANTLAASVTRSDDGANDDRIISASHAMSKNVSVYVAHEADGTANSDTTLAGFKVAF